MKEYTGLLNRILAEGEERHDRTGVGTISVFGGNDLVFDLRERFPLVTIKKTLWRAAFLEMLWFISGASNIKFLKDNNVKIWDAWADENGNLGPVYGVQWRSWPGKIYKFSHSEMIAWSEDPSINPNISKIAIPDNFIGNRVDKDSETPYETFNLYQENVDQLKNMIEMIKKNPTGRRHIVSAWNPGFLSEMGLPPCHYLFQCYVSNDGHLDLKLQLRSSDVFLGLPFNIAQYALLTHLIAQCTGLIPRFLRISYGDAHLYSNHIEQTKLILERTPVSCNPKLIINNMTDNIDEFKIEDFIIEGYESHSFVKAQVAV
jgi:thymidylate synthase